MDSLIKHSGLLDLFINKQYCLSPSTAIWRKTLTGTKTVIGKGSFILFIIGFGALYEDMELADT